MHDFFITYKKFNSLISYTKHFYKENYRSHGFFHGHEAPKRSRFQLKHYSFGIASVTHNGKRYVVV